jgi:hypothetical protein
VSLLILGTVFFIHRLTIELNTEYDILHDIDNSSHLSIRQVVYLVTRLSKNLQIYFMQNVLLRPLASPDLARRSSPFKVQKVAFHGVILSSPIYFNLLFFFPPFLSCFSYWMANTEVVSVWQAMFPRSTDYLTK